MQVHLWNDDQAERMNDLITRQVIQTDKMTVASLALKKGAVVPEHHHVNEQISMVVEGCLLFKVGHETREIKAGEILVIPSNVPHSVEVLEDSVAIDSFTPVREDWLRGDDAYLRK